MSKNNRFQIFKTTFKRNVVACWYPAFFIGAGIGAIYGVIDGAVKAYSRKPLPDSEVETLVKNLDNFSGDKKAFIETVIKNYKPTNSQSDSSRELLEILNSSLYNIELKWKTMATYIAAKGPDKRNKNINAMEYGENFYRNNGKSLFLIIHRLMEATPKPSVSPSLS